MGYHTRPRSGPPSGGADVVCWTLCAGCSVPYAVCRTLCAVRCVPYAVCRKKDWAYVFEFKVDGSAEEALKRIDGKGYMIPYKKEDRCVKVGVNISSATRTLESRKVAEEE